jgi:hypothetical protein
MDAAANDRLANRAVELAASGEYQYLYQIERRLHAEGFRQAQLSLKRDPVLRKNVRGLIYSCWPR